MNNDGVANLQDCLAICFRLFSVLIVIYTAREIPSSIFALFSKNQLTWGIAGIISSCIQLFIAYIIWIKSLPLSIRMLSFTNPEKKLLITSIDSVSRLAYIIIGMLILFYASIDGMYWLLLFFKVQNITLSSEVLFTNEQYVAMTVTALEFISGVIILWVIRKKGTA